MECDLTPWEAQKEEKIAYFPLLLPGYNSRSFKLNNEWEPGPTLEFERETQAYKPVTIKRSLEVVQLDMPLGPKFPAFEGESYNYLAYYEECTYSSTLVFTS